jgi:hypothetical protein
MTYKMRNLPCRDGLGNEMPWCVCGNVSYTLEDGTVMNGAGVLEWCWDREDAIKRMEMMRQDPRFSNLCVRLS